MLMERQYCAQVCDCRTAKSPGCTWPVQRHSLSSAQLTDKQENYGQKNAESEAAVKAVFSQSPISIPERFEVFEKESYAKITGLIDQVDEEKSGMKKEVFVSFLEKVYKRSK
jgi:hypothetical protein